MDPAALAAERLADRRLATGWLEPDEEVVEALRSASAPLVLAGPGVVADGAIPGLHALAVAGDVGVLNTWGAKGVFDWRSQHHLATVGLQALDASLGGVPECDLLVCTGIDELESPASAWRTVPAVDVAPASLAPLAERWSRPRTGVVMPPLRERLAAATQAGWAAEGAPLAPSQVTRNYGEVVSAGGVVAADPGLAGYWVARTLGTTRPGAVHVPAAPMTGFAVACAAEARRRWPTLPALAVVDVEPDEVPPGVAVEVWCDDGDLLDASTHAERLSTLLATGGVARVAPASWQLEAMVEAAGPITAWGGLLG